MTVVRSTPEWVVEQAKSEVGSQGTCTMPEIRAITVEKHLVRAKSMHIQSISSRPALLFCLDPPASGMLLLATSISGNELILDRSPKAPAAA